MTVMKFEDQDLPALNDPVAEEAAESNGQNFKNVAVISAERQEEQLTSTSFKDLVPIFRGLAIKGWLAFA
jgi:tRNA (cmo5U34)-methyltransferase